MNMPFELNAFVDRLASDAGLKLSLALVHFLWQGVLIAALAALLMRVVGRASSQRCYLIGVVAMTAMAVAPVVTFCLVEVPDWSQFIVEEEPRLDVSVLDAAELERLVAPFDSTSTAAIDEMPPRPLTWPDRVRLYQPYALLLWLCGTGLFALRLGIGLHASWRFGRGRAPLPDAWRGIAGRIASQLGVATPRIFVSERIVEAVAVGLLKPMVLLPAAWIGNVPPDVLEAVLAHEIAHLRRYDLWVNLLQRCVEAALFYHPAVWWLSRRIRQEREYCCDELAATVVSGRAAYARALEFVATERVAATQRMTFAAALAAGMGGSHMALLDRVRRVLGSDVKPNRGTWLSEGLLALAVPAALWACIATVAPSVATADDAAKTTQNDEDSSADTHIGDVEYWKQHGIGPGMITVLKDGELIDLATGELAGDAPARFLNNFIVRTVPPGDIDLPLELIEGSDRGLTDARVTVGKFLPAINLAGLESQPASDDVAKALRELREEMQSLRRELDELRGKRPASAKPAEIEYRIRKLPPEAPKPPSIKLPPAAGAAPAPPPLPATPHVKVDRLIRVAPLEIDGKKVNVIVEEFRQGEGPAKEIQLRILRRSSDVTFVDPAKDEDREWKLPPGAPKPRGDLQSVQHVEQLEIDGKKVNVIVEEFREGDGPGKKMKLRILKPAEPGEAVYADPAKGEKARQQAEEARARAEDVERKTRIDIDRKQLHEDAERAEREAAEQLEKARTMLEQSRRQFAEDHPAIREAEHRLEQAEKQRERHRLLHKTLQARPDASLDDIKREIDVLIDRRRHEGKPLEAEQRFQEMQRKLEEQQKIIEELQKKLDEASQKGDSPDSPEDATDATEAEAESSTRIDIPALSKGTLNQVQQAFSFSLGFAR